MVRVVTVGDMRRLEQAAVDGGVLYDTLMENAGAAVTEVVSQHYVDRGLSVIVLCGNGNNGGDGYVIARRLREQHPALSIHTVRVDGASVTELAHSKETLVYDIVDLSDEGILPQDWLCDAVVVDAVYGIGFHGRLSPKIKTLFSQITSAGIPVVAVDIPSGINADDGTADTATMSAQMTVTFTAPKPASVLPTSCSIFGELIVAQVGISPLLTAQFMTAVSPITSEMVRLSMPLRPADSHKGTFGSLLTICGSYGMAGAAMLSAKAALRSGVGLLHAALPRSVYPLVAPQIWEAVYHPVDETTEGTFSPESYDTLCRLMNSADAVLIGCGLSQHPQTTSLICRLSETIAVPAVIDADGLNILAPHILELKAMQVPLVITPHPAEMARLLQVDVKTIQRDRIGAAKQLATSIEAVVVLKGHRTVIAAPDGSVFINTNGNAGMATGGSGDVLAGMIAAFLAGGMSAVTAAMCGVYLHGEAGDMTARSLSQTAMLPTDMLDTLATLLSQYEKRE